VTVAANDAIRPIHERMPAILAAQDEAAWLDPGNPAPEGCLRAYPAERFELYPVSARLNGVREDDARLIERERMGLFG
jgi:putative SOS response-associated peptidase YedK